MCESWVLHQMEHFLSAFDTRWAKRIGEIRFETSKNLKDAHGRSGKILYEEIWTAATELAVYRVLGYDPPKSKDDWIGQYGKPDIKGTNIGVRGSLYKTGRLIIRPSDNVLHRYVLVIADPERNSYKLAGWLHGKDARRDFWFQTTASRPEDYAWWVPQAHLNADFEPLKCNKTPAAEATGV